MTSPDPSPAAMRAARSAINYIFDAIEKDECPIAVAEVARVIDAETGAGELADAATSAYRIVVELAHQRDNDNLHDVAYALADALERYYGTDTGADK